MTNLGPIEKLLCLCFVFDIFVSAEDNIKNMNDKGLQTSDIEENIRIFFIEKLFTKYGNTTVMTYEGFEHLMNGIELGNIILDDSLAAHHGKNSTDFKSLHNQNHSHIVEFKPGLPRRKRHAQNAHERGKDKGHSDVLETCLSPHQVLKLYGIGQHDVITKLEFLQLCPALIYQLDQRRCLKMDILIRYRSYELPEPMGKKAWIYGFVCMLVISVSGLLVVSSVPLLQRFSFNGILQFLISLAVGALTGDAMLHLLPHALAPHVETSHVHESDSHSQDNIYKGLCGLAAMYLFFLVGRIQTIIAHKQKRVNNNELDIISEQAEKLKTDGMDIVDYERELEVHSHHQHGHSHTNKLPTSVSGMVWRIVLGDGIHNFSDGLAIGVAFTNSITGGISTAIAVLCHELPHEMGDFAVLLKKGMSVKRAILFNCLSSILSLLGMVIGIAIGNIGTASIWIFVAIAGMFIYISLVDMIPELTMSSDGETNSWKRLLTQMCGFLIGTGIMLIIAIYEEQLKSVLE